MGFWDSLFGKGSNNNDVNTKGDAGRYENTKVLNFHEEIGTELAVDTDINPDNSYSQNGVLLRDTTNTLRLVYDGILAKSGADSVYTVVGYGNNLKWENVEYYQMNKTDGKAFETFIPVKRAGNINVAFKDSASNWDNNSGMNYSFSDQFNRDFE